MPSWSELLDEFNQHITKNPQAAGDWLKNRIEETLAKVAALRGVGDVPRNVIFYASGWLQKTAPPDYIIVSPEDINGFMTVMRGMDWSRGLTLILHTPGGAGVAAETIMSYLHTKFSYIESIVPTYAMSAGTMMALGTDNIVMGRQSQLGPIDAQLLIGNKSVSAAAIVDQFNRAKGEITGEKGNVANAHVWAPILQTLGPSLLQEAQMALDYGAGMVGDWLAKRMCSSAPDPKKAGAEIAEHFNARDLHKSHGKRIDREEARSKGLKVEDLETSDELQDAVLTAYHLCTIVFLTSPASKTIVSSMPGQAWIKNYAVQQQPMQFIQKIAGAGTSVAA